MSSWIQTALDWIWIGENGQAVMVLAGVGTLIIAAIGVIVTIAISRRAKGGDAPTPGPKQSITIRGSNSGNIRQVSQTDGK